MKKLKYLITSLLGVLTLVSCSNVSSSEETPARLKVIMFDGTYVQTYHFTWPIAFESYTIENRFLVINGSFFIPHEEVEVTDINELEEKFNKNGEDVPYVISYGDNVNDCVYSNFENTKWNLNKITDNNLCYFSVNIDLSPLVEKNKLLGDLVLISCFMVVHRFNGESI